MLQISDRMGILDKVIKKDFSGELTFELRSTWQKVLDIERPGAGGVPSGRNKHRVSTGRTNLVNCVATHGAEYGLPVSGMSTSPLALCYSKWTPGTSTISIRLLQMQEFCLPPQTYIFSKTPKWFVCTLKFERRRVGGSMWLKSNESVDEFGVWKVEARSHRLYQPEEKEFRLCSKCDGNYGRLLKGSAVGCNEGFQGWEALERAERC